MSCCGLGCALGPSLSSPTLLFVLGCKANRLVFHARLPHKTKRANLRAQAQYLVLGALPPPPGASNLSHSLDPWPLARLPRVPRVRADVRCGLHVPCGRRASESPLPACLRRQRPAPRLRPPSSLTACRSWSTSSAKWPGGRWWRWRSPPSCRAAGPTHLPDAPPPGRRAGAPASSTFPPR